MNKKEKIIWNVYSFQLEHLDLIFFTIFQGIKRKAQIYLINL